MAYQLSIPGGVYKLRLHFVEPQYEEVGQRQFDIRIQGVLATAEFDVFAAAGARNAATSLTFDVIATAGSGIAIDLRNTADKAPAILSAIESWREDATLVPTTTTSLELSLDNAANWSLLAPTAALDYYGRGEYIWPVGTQTAAGNTARVRATSGVADSSDFPFLIAGSGHSFYVNTKGDTNFAADDSGVTIQGPVSAEHSVTFDRRHLPTLQIGDPDDALIGNVFVLQDASDITIANLAITGGRQGVFADDDSDADRLVLRNNQIFANRKSQPEEWCVSGSE